MIIPTYWADARLHEERNGRSYTVRRSGWSDVDQVSAERHARERAAEALARIIAGESLPRRERKTAYGTEGVPIREEIVSRRGDVVITRNVYGARCLNSPNAFFIDVDFDDEIGGWLGCAILLTAFVAPFLLALYLLPFRRFLAWAIGIAFVAFFFAAFVMYATTQVVFFVRGGRERIARRRIERFFRPRDLWRWRLYRTPSGFRVLVMHRPFDPEDAEVQEALSGLGADPLYALMCRKQRCFRARVSPKPWRIGCDRIRPRGAVWPIHPDRLPERLSWIENYERTAADHAACRLEGEFGEGIPDPSLVAVQRLHDQLCQADSGLPIA